MDFWYLLLVLSLPACAAVLTCWLLSLYKRWLALCLGWLILVVGFILYAIYHYKTLLVRGYPMEEWGLGATLIGILIGSACIEAMVYIILSYIKNNRH